MMRTNLRLSRNVRVMVTVAADRSWDTPVWRYCLTRDLSTAVRMCKSRPGSDLRVCSIGAYRIEV